MKTAGEQIESIRAEWGRRLLILGHHYERSTVLRHVDVIGDSLELARSAGKHPEAERIVFCGVRFMAESADILTSPGQSVYMPDPSAGCPMANMAGADAMMDAWRVLEKSGGADFVPVVYVNSTAEVKARCGRLGGSTCTSSNAGRIFEWVFNRHKRVFFLPDEHLGANTAYDLGIRDEAVALYDPAQENGGLTPQDIAKAQVIVWKGFCIVHKVFAIHHVEQVRATWPDAKIIVHPETPKEVVRQVDAHGSTAQIIRYVESCPKGSTIVVGTEQNLVERLAEQQKGRVTVKALWPSICANMAKTNENNLLELLQSWSPRNAVRVPDSVAEDARKALSRMLEL